MNCLMLCAGTSRREGWQTLDANAERGADYIATIPPLPADVKAILWDEVEWIHGVSSLYPWEASDVLKELHSVMAAGGKLTLEQPDFSKRIESIEWIFGDPTLQEPLHMNRWGYTPGSLAAVLLMAGFSRIDVLPALHHFPPRDFRIEAIA